MRGAEGRPARAAFLFGGQQAGAVVVIHGDKNNDTKKKVSDVYIDVGAATRMWE
jgi:hypothetical protein